MKRIALVLALAGLVSFAAFVPAKPMNKPMNGAMGSAMGEHQTFTAHLAGSNEVPPVDTQAHGNAMFWAAGDSVRFRIVANGIQHVTGAHIHLGVAGANGPVVVSLFHPAEPTGTVNGTLVTGTFTASDLAGPLAGKTLTDLLADMSADSTYVNVHTTENPAGEIRGPVMSGKASMEHGEKDGTMGESGGMKH